MEFHVKAEHVLESHQPNAASGKIAPKENVGGGTGMMCLGFKAWNRNPL